VRPAVTAEPPARGGDCAPRPAGITGLAMQRLRRVDPSAPGLRRRRRGRGFEYLDPDGRQVEDPEVLARVAALAIPPAWRDVWISLHPMGHIQATGVDAAGRTQYRYHDRWRERRDAAKFQAMVGFARALPEMRERVEQDLALEGLPRDRVLAAAVRLLDIGFFRIGSEEYADENESFGLATIRKEHVTVGDGVVTFDYPAKSGQRRVQSVADPEVAEIVGRLRRRRGGSPELLAYRDERGAWRDLRSDDVNAYVKEVTGGDFTAKDFRTWSATVLAAVALATRGRVAATASARKRAIAAAVKEVAFYLGNTPTVCRASYIDPRVIDRYQGGLTIAPALAELAEPGERETPGEVALDGRVEQAVLDLIAGDEESPVVVEAAA
jgi:DNA topoisomerase-1